MQFIEQGLSIQPHHAHLLELEASAREGQELLDAEDEAENCFSNARWILNDLLAYRKTFGSDAELVGTIPANVDIALQDLDRALELFPDDPEYLNAKALLLWQGKGLREDAIPYLEKAVELDPDDKTIVGNLKGAKASACFIATAAFGTPFATEVEVLRAWRDQCLARSPSGRRFVAAYYRLSPPIARFIASHPALKRATRSLLAPITKRLALKYGPQQSTEPPVSTAIAQFSSYYPM